MYIYIYIYIYIYVCVCVCVCEYQHKYIILNYPKMPQASRWRTKLFFSLVATKYL